MGAIANYAKMWADKIPQGRESPTNEITVELREGKQLRGTLHPEFRKGPVNLLGKCMDLGAAYKQCPVAASHARYSVFALKNPDTGATELFIATALPFGASAAVHGFNRAAMAIDHVLHQYVGVRARTTSTTSRSLSPNRRPRRSPT